MTVFLFMNEQHKLLPSQQQLISARFGEAEITQVLIPASGWNKAQIAEAAMLPKFADSAIIVSPIPLLLGLLVARGSQGDHGGAFSVLVFHNESRESKEIVGSDGNKKLVHVLSPNGWELIGVN